MNQISFSSETVEDFQRDVLAPETARLPDTAGSIPECLQNNQLRGRFRTLNLDLLTFH